MDSKTKSLKILHARGVYIIETRSIDTEYGEMAFGLVVNPSDSKVSICDNIPTASIVCHMPGCDFQLFKGDALPILKMAQDAIRSGKTVLVNPNDPSKMLSKEAAIQRLAALCA